MSKRLDVIPTSFMKKFPYVLGIILLAQKTTCLEAHCVNNANIKDVSKKGKTN